MSELTQAARALKERDFPRAAAIARTVIASEPDRVEAWSLLALATEASGATNDALAVYERGLASTHGAPVLRNNFATLLTKLGDHDRARSQLEQALARDATYAAAWSNLGALLAATGKMSEAENAMQSAIAIDSTNPLYRLDLARLYLASGQIRLAEQQLDEADALVAPGKRAAAPTFVPQRCELALAMAAAQRQAGNRPEEFRHVLRAVELGAGSNARQHFVAALDGVEFLAPWPLLKSVLLRAFNENWGFTEELGQASMKQLLVEPGYRELLRLIEMGKLDVGNDAIARAASDPLLLHVLERTLVTHPEFETLVAGLRRAMLELSRSNNGQDSRLRLVAAIANQCFTTAYAWFADENETARADALVLEIESAISQRRIPSCFALAVLGCYRALHTLEGAERLLEFDWPSSLQWLIQRQIKEPLEEGQIKREILSLTPIRNAVSQEARGQYEEDPYPTWLEPPHAPNRQDPTLWLRQKFPEAPAIEQFTKPVHLLVSGCGTGGEPVGFSQSMNAITIRAFDLSLSSLAYAIRKTRELNITNIEYHHADILELDRSFGQFDIVVSAGVLHHLEDPLKGWRVLRELTKPGGYLLIALYSARARRLVVEGQRFAREGGYDSSRKSLRQLRHDVYQMHDAAAWRADVIRREEFYNLSMLRDLLFHVQEHRFTPETIERNINELGLQFCGFKIGQETAQLFRMKFGTGADLLSLKQWNDFEEDYPDTFTGMYHFLCRRPSC